MSTVDDLMQRRYDAGAALVVEAGALAGEYFRRFDTLTVTSKGVQDMASEADLAVELLIRKRLKEQFPADDFLGDDFLGEETGRGDVQGAEGIWVVDPIDGTQPFISGMSSWAVSIAYVHDGVLELGFVAAPARGEVFTGRRGHPATLNGKPIHVSNASKLTDGIIAIGYSTRVHPDSFLPMFSQLLHQGAMSYREGSAALTLCSLACGRIIGYIELHLNSWDCLGAIAVIEGAGGQVSR
jgi:myo-inositol-1(or 4)-monophosphatase